ncbi:MAG: TRAP transporter substrate-binding protein [Syntrophobacterales bacterium]|jgi:TRAP-type C4-dicarboxylate transport system substrate-binding protein|nr:TRAP transporter substrate-binding protein [Syntrophobacterales bacterium]
MNKKSVVTVVLGISFVFFCLAAFPAISSAQKAITLNYSNFFPAPHKSSVASEQWCKEIEKRTGGKVKFAYFPGGILTPAAQTYDNIVKGIADVGCSALAYTRGKFPLMEATDLPLGYRNGTQATNLINTFYSKFKPKELDDVKVLYFHAHGPGILHTKKEVSKLEDLKGKKIRATGLAAKIVEALGGAPVGATMPETYDALRTGVVDGSLAPYEALKGWKWGEVVSFTTLNYGAAYTTGFFVVMNKTAWNSLPPDIQKVFDEVSKEWITVHGKVWDEIDKEGREFAKVKGLKEIAFSKEENARWAAKVKPLFDEYTKNAKAKGLPGDEALKFCFDFLKK